MSLVAELLEVPVRLQSKVEIGLDLSVRQQAALQPQLHLARAPVQQKPHDDGGTEEPEEGDEELGPEHGVRGGRASAPPEPVSAPAPTRHRDGDRTGTPETRLHGRAPPRSTVGRIGQHRGGKMKK